MPKVGMEPVRRRQIIEAVMDCIHVEGIENTSLKAIARHAGVAPSHILYYFGDKNAVIAAVYRHLYVRLSAATRVRLKQSNSPLERLYAVLEAQVSAEMITPRVVATWFAISAQAMNTPALARLEKINTQRMTSNIVHDLRSLGFRRDDARTLATEYLAVVYGLWNLLAHGTVSNADDARNILTRFLESRLTTSKALQPS
ncbi:MAG: transcriptional regulator BetI [Pseudomonadota bacterium]